MAGAVTCVIALVFRSDPVWLVAGLGLWLLALVALGLILHWLAKTERDLEARFPSPSPIDEPSPESQTAEGRPLTPNELEWVTRRYPED